MKKVCVFCGSSKGTDPAYMREAGLLGKRIADKGYELVYGGANVGLMGMLARSCSEHGGKVTGVMPQHLVEMGVARDDLFELKVVESMHERKMLMSELADAFIALPGGIGTIEELFEIFTWFQLGLHNKPIALINTNGFYDELLKFMDRVVADGFFRKEHLDMLIVAPEADTVLDKIENYTPETFEKWFDVEENKV